jgi:predicted NAD/FAD-binding protein
MKRLAIIGSGISGLGAAYLLRDHFAITLYEQHDYLGGHTNTIMIDEAGRSVPIDTGFMVFNHVTYPNLTRLFSKLNVATKRTEMSFSVQHQPSGLEYNGGSLSLLFAQRKNLLNLRHWKMLLAINRFNQEAVPALTDGQFAALTLREYIEARGYGEDLWERYLVPMSSAVWSTPPELMAKFPAMTLLRFWHNHGFLGLHTQHPWWTVCDGAKSYVSKIKAAMGPSLEVRGKVIRVERSAAAVTITTADGHVDSFPKAILAAHADQSMALLADPTPLETKLLTPFKYQPNHATLHTDTSVMPRTKRAWAAWNYRYDGGGRPSTHYWMNRLQGVSDHQQYFVSLNCTESIDPAKVLRNIAYEHPLFDLPALAAQRRLPELNQLSPDQTTYYAGAWVKYGFHEDGFTSGLDCARAIVGSSLWT